MIGRTCYDHFDIVCIIYVDLVWLNVSVPEMLFLEVGEDRAALVEDLRDEGG